MLKKIAFFGQIQERVLKCRNSVVAQILPEIIFGQFNSLKGCYFKIGFT